MSARSEQDAARTVSALAEIGRKRGYQNPEWWAQSIMVGRARRQALRQGERVAFATKLRQIKDGER